METVVQHDRLSNKIEALHRAVDAGREAEKELPLATRELETIEAMLKKLQSGPIDD